tara:strand:- start:378 stop:563 length:186 start_codon:yes stop_codon:yes gene_type:complete
VEKVHGQDANNTIKELACRDERAGWDQHQHNLVEEEKSATMHSEECSRMKRDRDREIEIER